jgi:ATP-dependent DNA ligase
MATAEFVEPMLCLAAEKILECPAWQYELKLDGYRAISVRTKAGVEPWSGQLWSQSGYFALAASALIIEHGSTASAI